MTKKYYINNMFWGWFIGILLIYSCLDNDIREYKWLSLFIISIIGIGLYPLAKFAVESFFLTFTTKEFWNTGWFIDTPGKKGILALYSITIFIFAIPISILYIIAILAKRLLI
ncbi:TPA: colicin E1 family microcin immunity protein [Proteus mirabilis]|uniref:colicin E1 family microcin immunity protein n=1 Tax=Proteus mirabilis TaxID=584 RepID=UPI00053788F9|nr:colicin E1 family microcin immunity protein [Proteus mirabilis]MDM3554832.1 colicin E1 family microcin immunity protein [Proteus mirabilis]MDM3632219.1 colicin E1 family microcin immunity protein [Proteus mirabilis]MDM3749178.1 colicin E1 family microcin immunity protein [Proteus mirabilis]MDM9218168.1 colicin E1 family microcin immunity protein [Proteus mirabilis]